MTEQKFDLNRLAKAIDRLGRNGGKVSNSEKTVFVKRGSGIKVWGAAEGIARFHNYKIVQY